LISSVIFLKVLYVFESSFVCYKGEILLVLAAEQVEDQGHLVLVVVERLAVFAHQRRERVAAGPLEKLPLVAREALFEELLAASDDLGDDAASTPHVYFLRVVGLQKDNLWRPVGSPYHFWRKASLA